MNSVITVANRHSVTGDTVTLYFRDKPPLTSDVDKLHMESLKVGELEIVLSFKSNIISNCDSTCAIVIATVMAISHLFRDEFNECSGIVFSNFLFFVFHIFECYLTPVQLFIHPLSRSLVTVTQ